MKKLVLLLLLGTITTFQAKAHVNLNNPLGSESYFAGDTVNVQWQIAITHTTLNWDLFFSSDGGANWDTIQIDISATALDFDWVVPQMATTQARIKIVMDNAGTDYNDVSGDFTIVSTLGLQESIYADKVGIYPMPVQNSSTFSFENTTNISHTFSIYDLQGRLVRVLNNITTNQVIFDRNELKSGLYFFKLMEGDKLISSAKFLIGSSD